MNYSIKGSPFPVAICNLSANESVVCQKGAMIWMTSNMSMETSGGGIGKMFSKALTGESMFQNTYTAEKTDGMIAFGSNVPGTIVPIDISASNTIVAQKSSFLASSPSVNFELFFQKKGMTGFFGGEGFIMQKFTGNGPLLLEFDGSVVEYDLEAGQTLLVDTGYLVAMTDTVSISVEKIKGIGNIMLGGEGLFNTKLTGPGHVWLQTMPISNLAGSISRCLPMK